MVDKIRVMSVFDAFEYVMDHYAPAGLEELAERHDRYAMISIQDAQSGGFGFRFVREGSCVGVLTLLFDDVEGEVDGAVTFSGVMASNVVAFLDEVRDVADTLVIHCFAGQSRSRAVGLFAASYYGLDDSALRRMGCPNALVSRLLDQAR